MFGSLRSGVVGVLVLGGLASADVIEFDVIKSRYFSQVSSAAPTVAYTHEFAVEIELDAGDMAAGNVNGLTLTEYDPEYWEYLASFPSQAAMDVAFPANTVYNIHLQGGVLGTRDESVTLPVPGGYPSIPALTPTSFAALQSADASQSLLLEWTAPAINTNVVGLEIFDPLTDNTVLDALLPVGLTSFLVPAGTMQQNKSYEFLLFFANGTFFNGQAAPAGFGVGAVGIVAYTSELEISFQTSAPAPCVDFVYYDVIKAGNYEQVFDGLQPVQPIGYEFATAVDVVSAGQIGTSSLFVNGVGPGQPLDNTYAGEFEFEAKFFGPGAKLNLDAAFPNPGNFMLNGGGGSLGTRTQMVTMGPDAYPPVPVFLGTSYSDLQGMDHRQSLSVSWAPPAGSTDRVFLEIYDVLADDFMLELEFPLGSTSFLFPPHILQAGREYELHVYFANVVNGVGDACPGFGTGSQEIVAFLSDTLINFTTEVPYDAICNGDGGDQMGCSDCPCNNNAAPGTVGGCLNSAASSSRLLATGDSSISLPPASSTDLRFALTGAPANAFCILTSGDGVAPGNMANPCFGANSGGLAAAFDGLRCAIINTRRHGGRSADGFGNVGVTNNPWGGEAGPGIGLANAGGGFSAGQTRYFQVINRDNPLFSCMRGLNTSQAVRITFTP